MLSDLSTAISLLESLGFVINWKKSVATPTLIIEYLGIVVNSIEMSFALPEKRILLVQDMFKRPWRLTRCRCVLSLHFWGV